ncbi:TPA: hypothetical protein PNO09_002142 [Legionella pneumophila]|nr:hypothetical protein [Legionella pneumophila]HBD7168436.1 hypothetical protein [Legionella pneumophila]HBD7457046.1 hypothetical protein [Legionella pneumophila]HCX3308477.1 hypothetical protein [Legionella pneumophila]HDI4879148.1 hypothetical protein [Legionella pneumophila]
MSYDFPVPPDHLLEAEQQTFTIKSCYQYSYEWYRYVGQLCMFSAHIDVKNFPGLSVNQYAIIVGLLCRITRLMLNNMTLSCKGNNGETTSIIDRCINESAIKLIWLCNNPTSDKFNIFISDGLKNDLKLKKDINQIILERNTSATPMEQRMLDSIENYIKQSGLTESEIENTKKMPDVASILKKLESHDITYRCLMTMGAHSIHGTWSSLIKDFVVIESGKALFKDAITPTQ